jgi:hypothetical protein
MNARPTDTWLGDYSGTHDGTVSGPYAVLTDAHAALDLPSLETSTIHADRSKEGWNVNTRHQSSMFDRFAESAANFAGHAVFFGACVLLIAVWIPSYVFIRDLNTWQLIINTATTIVTFLLVALLQNSQRRSDEAMHAKLNALADGLADLMAHVGGDAGALDDDIRELRQAVGLERPAPKT